MAKYVKTEQGYQEIKEVNFNKMEANNPVGTGSFSMGRKPNTVIGINSHAEGYDTTASGNYSHAEGSRTTASGSDSHAEGFKTIASSAYSHAEGSGTTASSDCSHAEGSGTTASGSESHAEGFRTTASSSDSHAEGIRTTASGVSSHAEGIRTTASSDYQHVQGKYNVEDSQGKYAHIVGNGTGSARSNAHTLDWNGNVWYAGDVYVGSTSGVNKDEGSKKLATEEYVDSKQDTLIQSGATVGQIAKITAVDSNGKPTAWQAVDIPSGGGDAWEFGGTIPLDLTTPTAIYEFAPCSIWKKVRIVRVRTSYNANLKSNVWYGASNCKHYDGSIGKQDLLYISNGYVYHYIEMMADNDGGIIGTCAWTNHTSAYIDLQISSYLNNRVAQNIPTTYGARSLTKDSNWEFHAVDPSAAWDGNETYYWWGVRA